jgi:hypothetical protein
MFKMPRNTVQIVLLAAFVMQLTSCVYDVGDRHYHPWWHHHDDVVVVHDMH